MLIASEQLIENPKTARIDALGKESNARGQSDTAFAEEFSRVFKRELGKRILFGKDGAADKPTADGTARTKGRLGNYKPAVRGEKPDLRLEALKELALKTVQNAKTGPRLSFGSDGKLTATIPEPEVGGGPAAKTMLVKSTDEVDEEKLEEKLGDSRKRVMSRELQNDRRDDVPQQGMVSDSRNRSNDGGSPGGTEGDAGSRNQKSDAKHTAVLEIQDYRTKSAKGDSSVTTAKADSPDATDTGRPEVDRSEVDQNIRLVRVSSGRSAETAPLTREGTARVDSPFSAYVRENLSNQIVKQSGIILRDNDQGEIRLTLKPEHLGRVRIRIQLNENNLSGRIFVDSGFVKDSMDQNLDSLYRAFRAGGFETTSFEVVVDGRGEGNRSRRDLQGEIPGKTLKQLDDAVPILEEVDQRSELINLMI